VYDQLKRSAFVSGYKDSVYYAPIIDKIVRILNIDFPILPGNFRDDYSKCFISKNKRRHRIGVEVKLSANIDTCLSICKDHLDQTLLPAIVGIFCFKDQLNR
jgi:hypothetical protein